MRDEKMAGMMEVYLAGLRATSLVVIAAVLLAAWMVDGSVEKLVELQAGELVV
jgi:hypothetical protein